MRRILGTALIGFAAAATAALAQSVDVDDPLVVYRTRPTVETIGENFPSSAYNDRKEGYAELCCLVRENGTLACAVIGESPAGYGFGEAARRVVAEMRLTQQSAAAVRQRGEPVSVPINFRQPRFAPAPQLNPPPRCGRRTPPSQPETAPVVNAER